VSLIGVIDHYRAVLSGFGQVVDFDISALDRLQIPVTSCSLAVDGGFRTVSSGQPGVSPGFHGRHHRQLT